MYLIQRGKIKDKKDIDVKRGISGVISLDYMGSAEFEWGTLPRSLQKIARNYDNFDIVKTGHKSPDGRYLFLISEKDKYDSICKEINNLLLDPRYLLKEESFIREALGLSNSSICVSSYSYKKTNFWWSVDNSSFGRDNKECDWMLFLGKNKDKQIFDSALKADMERFS